MAAPLQTIVPLPFVAVGSARETRVAIHVVAEVPHVLVADRQVASRLVDDRDLGCQLRIAAAGDDHGFGCQSLVAGAELHEIAGEVRAVALAPLEAAVDRQRVNHLVDGRGLSWLLRVVAAQRHVVAVVVDATALALQVVAAGIRVYHGD
jgi:hypothetical protein